ncbi:hypothetical protein [Caballeronia sp. TF1N1]|uniref:hypothetical protein n=1 Tax=Caballeronia sp. TF1N1 TaxID=2878153 RepID=UPI001FCFBB7E|nr:hypothetical protein [Caballeronia sp. TF1N1]
MPSRGRHRANGHALGVKPERSGVGAIALGSLGGGAVVEHLGIASTMRFSAILAALSPIVVATTFGTGRAPPSEPSRN